MRFPYKTFLLPRQDPATGSFRLQRPIIPIALSNASAGITLMPHRALVDSGADWCMFDTDVGEMLGIDLRRGEVRQFAGVETVAGAAYFHPIQITIGGMTVEVRAAFTANMNTAYGLLGQAGFFDRFIVTMTMATPTAFVDIQPLQ